MTGRSLYAGITRAGMLEVGSTVDVERRTTELRLFLLDSAPGDWQDERDLIGQLGGSAEGRERFEPTSERFRIVFEGMDRLRQVAAHPRDYDSEERAS